jgi:hypothetical protein
MSILWISKKYNCIESSLDLIFRLNGGVILRTNSACSAPKRCPFVQPEDECIASHGNIMYHFLLSGKY